MEKLLRWGLANSDPELLARQASGEEAGRNPKAMDPGVIDAILGKDDATLMRECMETISSNEADLEKKLVAFDNLEMLVEQIDNAKNLEPLKLWDPIIKLLADEEAAIRKYAAWVIGTATQNNPAAQNSFLDHRGLEALLEAFRVEQVVENSKKLAYSLSCSTRHHPRALAVLKELGGLQLISDKLQMPEYDLSLKTRLVFMLSSLVNDDVTIVNSLADAGIFQHLVELICIPANQSNADFVEKVLGLLSNSISVLSKSQKLPSAPAFREQLGSLKTSHAPALSESDWEALMAAF